MVRQAVTWQNIRTATLPKGRGSRGPAGTCLPAFPRTHMDPGWSQGTTRTCYCSCKPPSVIVQSPPCRRRPRRWRCWGQPGARPAAQGERQGARGMQAVSAGLGEARSTAECCQGQSALLPNTWMPHCRMLHRRSWQCKRASPCTHPQLHPQQHTRSCTAQRARMVPGEAATRYSRWRWGRRR